MGRDNISGQGRNGSGRALDRLTVFLWGDGVEAIDNAAEHALRPAVVMRKITGRSRSEGGARATAVLLSVIKTAQQQNRPLFETIKTLLMNACAGKTIPVYGPTFRNTAPAW